MRTAVDRLEQPEAAFQAAIVELATRADWRVFHPRKTATARLDARGRPTYRTPLTGHAGWPDLALARRGVLILAELKAERGRIAPEQRAWLERLEEVELNASGAVLVRVWRPRDWPEIEQLLVAR